MTKKIFGAACLLGLLISIASLIVSGTWVRPFVLIHDGIEWLGFYLDKERKCVIPTAYPEKLDEECVKQLRQAFHKRAIEGEIERTCGKHKDGNPNRYKECVDKILTQRRERGFIIP